MVAIPNGSSVVLETGANQESQSGEVRVTVFVTLGIMAVFAILRIYVRLKRRLWGIDDWIFLLAVISSFITCVFTARLYSREELGKHLLEVPMTFFTPAIFKARRLTNSRTLIDQQGLTIVIFLHYVSMSAMRLSILSLLLQLFRPSKYIRLLVWPAIIVVVVLYITITTLTIIFTVPKPGDDGWGAPSPVHAQANFATAVVGPVVDWYVLIIPVWHVFHLNLCLRKKIGLAAIFLTGLIVCGLSIIVSYYRARIVSNELDATWYGALATKTSIAEVNIGIACSCMPVIACLFHTWIDHVQMAWLCMKHKFKNLSDKNLCNSSTSNPEGSVDDGLTGPPPCRLAAIGPFRRGTRHTQPTQAGPSSESDEITRSAYFELKSVDVDYHAHIEGGRMSRIPSKATGSGV